VHEDVLRQFFEGGAFSRRPGHDLEGALVSDGPGVTGIRLSTWLERLRFNPTPRSGVRCRARRAIQLALLEAIGFLNLPRFGGHPRSHGMR